MWFWFQIKQMPVCLHAYCDNIGVPLNNEQFLINDDNVIKAVMFTKFCRCAHVIGIYTHPYIYIYAQYIM